MVKNTKKVKQVDSRGVLTFTKSQNSLGQNKLPAQG